MKYSTAIAAAFAAGVSASYSPGYAPGSGEGEQPWKGGEGEGWSSEAAPVPTAAPSAAPEASWVTDVLTAYTTYCPEATEITHGGKTYSVTEATTITITGPVTVTYPVTVSTYSSCVACSAAPPPPPPSSVAPPPPPAPLNTAPVYSVPSNATVPVATGTAPVVTSSPTTTEFPGAASTLKAGSIGFAAIFGLVAYAL